MTVKNILVTNGTTGWTGQTRAATSKGYRAAAERIWPYPGEFKGRVWVADTKTDETIFDEFIIFTKGETA